VWINRVKNIVLALLANAVRQAFAVITDISSKEAMRKPMSSLSRAGLILLSSALKSNKRVIVLSSLWRRSISSAMVANTVPTSPREPLRPRSFFRGGVPLPRQAFPLDHCPVKMLLAAKMAENDCLVHPSRVSDLPGGRAPESLQGKQFCGSVHDLLPAVLSGSPRAGCCHYKYVASK